ncbi:SCO2525 family SAM-dependent methyltransferase [Cryptosporangium phraense]|uniref:Methyltransferase n=1 Tax=Cryptosporangium phraense TaxID=2593070 RepID=A0A545AW23_9ACTN|nr:SCO2525 family SAM-dependent methyltransferase [Cryptosporangium phraense]TQS45542.1 methyltransferase [Cryptosporangium phraense]
MFGQDVQSHVDLSVSGAQSAISAETEPVVRERRTRKIRRFLSVVSLISLLGWVTPPLSKSRRVKVRNADVDWDQFDPESYIAVNYRRVRDDDRQIVNLIGDHFAQAGLKFRPGVKGNSRGVGDSERPAASTVVAVDVGCGANLYPALSMLPFAHKVHLIERGAANVAWLKQQRLKFDHNWLDFWSILRGGRPDYERVRSPRTMFRQKAEVRQGNLFDLPVDTYDLGTMFFVAESMSTEYEEFSGAMTKFIGSLHPGAPFAVAFMEDSHGYEVDGIQFPAFGVGKDEITLALADIATLDDVARVTYGNGEQLRADHHAMLVAMGRRC